MSEKVVAAAALCALLKTYKGTTEELLKDVSNFLGIEQENRWIPVTERLPKKGGWYFVTWEDQFKTVRGVTVSEFFEPKGLTDIGRFEGFVLREITAWMPLPEPYKGGDA